MKGIRVAVHGAAGKMGQEVVGAILKQKGMVFVGAVDKRAESDTFKLPDGSGDVPFAGDTTIILKKCRPDVLVDFTIAEATMPAVRAAAEAGVNLVIGTTGLTEADISEIGSLARENNIGAVLAPNFALGAVLMMHLSKIAAKYMDTAEIIEFHHQKKVDFPSGTAIATARAMSDARGKPFENPPQKAQDKRGKEISSVPIHSVRLPGFVARQEVIFGGPGQTLSIEHNSVNRQCFMPGVILAIKEVVKKKGLVYGLDKLLGL